MNNFKNLLIATLTGLLALSLFSQPAQSAPKTYDAVKLVEYENCLRFFNQNIVGEGSPNLRGYPELFKFHIEACRTYRP